METAEELGERTIIKTIWGQLSEAPNLAIPFGDDVSALEYAHGHVAVLKTDMLVGKTDIPEGMTYSQAARKAIVMNVSDFAAKGVRPLGLVVSLGIPPSLTKAEIEQIGQGLDDGAREYETYVVGGDTNEASDLIISVGLFGLAKKATLMTRNGSHPGEIVATTGAFGLSSSGLKMLTEGLSAPRTIREKLLHAVLMPAARLKEGIALAKAGVATASVDSSDGLAWSLHEISRASNVGCTIDEPPIAQEAYEFGARHDLDPLDLSLYGGEEYELVVTIPPTQWIRAKEAVAEEGGTLKRIGETTADKNLLVKQEQKTIPIKAKGYEHFNKKRRR